MKPKEYYLTEEENIIIVKWNNISEEISNQINSNYNSNFDNSKAISSLRKQIKYCKNPLQKNLIRKTFK